MEGGDFSFLQTNQILPMKKGFEMQHEMDRLSSDWETAQEIREHIHRQFSKVMERNRAFQRAHRKNYIYIYFFQLGNIYTKKCWTERNSGGKDLACKKQGAKQRELLPNPFILIQSFPAHLDFLCLKTVFSKTSLFRYKFLLVLLWCSKRKLH